MVTGLQYFWVVAQEQSITRAARKLFISQQALSDQMKRLEEQYHTVLFQRKPHFSLTPSGEALLRTAAQIRRLEESLSVELSDIQNSGIGRIRLGLHSTRAPSFFPAVMEQFHRQYPLVDIQVEHSDTQNFESMLTDGRLDLFLGIDAGKRPEFETIPLGDETVCLIAAEPLLQQRLNTSSMKEISAPEIIQLPLIVSPPSSNLRNKIDAFFQREQVTPHYSVIISDFGVQTELAAKQIGACFCPEQVLKRYVFSNGAASLRKLYIRGFSEKNRLSLVCYKNTYRPRYLQVFMDLMAESYTVDQDKPLGDNPV